MNNRSDRHQFRTDSAQALNRYSMWQYMAIALVVLMGVVYATPNLYPPDHAIQIRVESNFLGAMELVQKSLEKAQIPYKSIARKGQSLLVRFADSTLQLQAQIAIRQSFIVANRPDVIALNLAPTTPEWLARMGGQPMKYGLDLSGGIHFLLEVDIDKAVSERMVQAASAAKAALRSAKIRYRSVKSMPDRVVADFNSEQDRDKAITAIAEEAGDEYDLQPEIFDGGPGIRMQFRPQALLELEDYAISQNLQSLRNRVNELGVSEPLVQRLGRNRIVLDLPGIQDSAKAKEIIGKVANLEFHLEAGVRTPASSIEVHAYEGVKIKLERRNIVTGERVTNAQTGFDPETALPQVNIHLDGKGGELMHQATRHNVGRRMGVIFKEIKTRTTIEQLEDGTLQEQVEPYETKKVINLATIQSPLGNRFRITGLSQGEARDLALLLRAGALAAPMYIVEERTVGASLGQDNIDAGVRAITLGMALVLFFMLVFFRSFGVIANIALVINVLLLAALMSVLEATLTLPGVAGIVLTVGMAVDANVLIFFRIREELNNQQPPQTAIHKGFEQAMVTIFDANLTTFIVAIILYMVGTGPVKGFAVTLSVGIITSVFTAVLVTRSIVNLVYGYRKVTKLAI